MLEKTLKKCPFCGGKAKINAIHYSPENKEYIFIECESCMSRGPEIMYVYASFLMPHAIDEATRKWNRRI